MFSFFQNKSPAFRFALTAALCGTAVALHWTLFPVIGARIPFMFFLAALALAAALIGRASALTVLAVGLVNGALMLAPTGSLVVADFPDRIIMFAYAVIGAMLAFLGARLMIAKRRAIEAERRLSIAQEDTGVGLFDIDLKSRAMFASTSLAKMLERRLPSSHLGTTISLEEWNAQADPQELQESRAMLRRRLSEGAQSYEREHALVLADGQERWFHSTLHIERDSNGRASRVRGATVDITERKRTMAQLAQAQTELMQQVADLQRLHVLSSGVLEMEDLRSQLRLILQTLIEFCNGQKGLVSLFDPASGRLIVEVEIGFHRQPEQLAPLVSAGIACGRAFSEGKRIAVEDIRTEASHADYAGPAREFGFRALLCTPLTTASGDVNGVMSLYFAEPHAPDAREMRLADICAAKATAYVERSRAQQVAQQSDQRFRVALDSSAVPFSMFEPVRDEHGRIVDFRWSYANRAAGRALQRDAAGLSGQHLSQVIEAGAEGAELLASFSAVMELGEPREFELSMKTGQADGWHHVIAFPLQGAVAAWFADVTERKLDERALQDADRRKDEFLAMLAHELRNPLAPIRQAVMISKTPGATETQKRWSHDVIERQVQHMALLLDDLLDVSRITRGMLPLRKSHVALTDIVEAAMETVRPLVEARGHRLLIDIPPDVRFEADPLRVAQIVGNLLVNAAKYTDAGGTIRLNAERTSGRGGRGGRGDINASEGEIRISVIDNGIGIPRAALDEIFEMFTQVRSPRDQSGGGLGIGLALAKGLAELHGGSLEASSEGAGAGSRFTLTLPLGAAPPPESTQPQATVAPTRARRILVADDNRDAAETLAEFLRMEGHEVYVAYDGIAALAEFGAQAPEVALLDIGMPGLSGNEVAQRARTKDAGREAVLVAVTGWGQDKDRMKALESGFDHHLTKPVDLKRLRKLLHEI